MEALAVRAVQAVAAVAAVAALAAVAVAAVVAAVVEGRRAYFFLILFRDGCIRPTGPDCSPTPSLSPPLN